MTKRKKQTTSSLQPSVSPSVEVPDKNSLSATSKSSKVAAGKRAKAQPPVEQSSPIPPAYAAEDVDIDDIFKKARAKKQSPKAGEVRSNYCTVLELIACKIKCPVQVKPVAKSVSAGGSKDDLFGTGPINSRRYCKSCAICAMSVEATTLASRFEL